MPEPVPTYFGWAVFCTLVCFLPAGVVALVHALRAQRLAAAGEVAFARREAALARRWCWISFWVAVALVVLLLLSRP